MQTPLKSGCLGGGARAGLKSPDFAFSNFGKDGEVVSKPGPPMCDSDETIPFGTDDIDALLLHLSLF